MKKIIVFDMDGVLFDTEAVCFEYNCQSYPDMTREIMAEVLCGNFHEQMEQLTIPRVVESKEENEIRVLAYQKKKINCPLFDGMYELLSKLHEKGYTLTLNTSARKDFSVPLLENTGILQLFDFVGTKEISRSKVEKFKLIQEKYMVDAKDLLFVTDTLGDVREAHTASVPTIAVTWGAHKREYFTREHIPTLVAIVDSVAELKNILLK